MSREKKIIRLAFAIALALSSVGLGAAGDELAPPKLSPGPSPVKDLGAAVNSPDNDIDPTVAPDGNALFFASDRPGGQGGLDIWMSRRVKTVWQPARNLGAPLNTTAAEVPGSFSLSENALYFTRGGDDGDVSGDIYVSYLTAKGWSRPESLGPPINTEYLESSPSISSDGSFMVFTSTRPGGLGKTDIWMSRRKAGNEANNKGRLSKAWEEPRNLGPDLNTNEAELSCFLMSDDQSLYFSAEGSPGPGLTSIYRSRYVAGKWYPAEPVQVFLDNHVFSRVTMPGSQELAYFNAEGMESGLGKNDIYEMALPIQFNKCNLVVVRGSVKDPSGTPLGAVVEIKDRKTAKALAQGATDPATGDFQLGVESDLFKLEVSSDGFARYEETVTVPPHETCAVVFKKITLKKK